MLRERTGRRYIQCPSCFSQILFPVPDQNELNAYYTQMMHEGNYKIGCLSTRSNQIKFSNLMKKIMESCRSLKLTPCKTLLDIGCFTGNFLDVAKEHGFETYGFDTLTEALSNIADKHHVWSGSIFNTPLNLPRFDLVTLIDTIEHVANYRYELSFIRKCLLRKNGGLFITTPDATSSVARLMRHRWGALDGHEHLLVYSKYGLSMLLRSNGFHVLRIQNYWKHLELGYLNEMTSHWQFGGKIKPFPFPRFVSRLKVPVCAGDMLVAAQAT